MKEIKLTKGKVAIVDDGDFEYLNQFRWICQTTPRGGDYAARRVNNRLVLMHRVLLEPLKGMVVDHINSNGLDNRRSNIRVCTQSQNCMNSSPRRTTTERGIKFDKRRKINPWYARVFDRGREIFLGAFPTKELALQARARAVQKHYGEFAYNIGKSA